MTQLANPMDANEGAHVVHRPRATDAIGQALKGAFGVPSLPADMTALLDRMNQTPLPRH